MTARAAQMTPPAQQMSGKNLQMSGKGSQVGDQSGQKCPQGAPMEAQGTKVKGSGWQNINLIQGFKHFLRFSQKLTFSHFFDPFGIFLVTLVDLVAKKLSLSTGGPGE